MDKQIEQLTPEELSLSNMWQLEALYRLMVKKKLITEKEFLDEFTTLKVEYDSSRLRASAFVLLWEYVVIRVILFDKLICK